MKSEIHVVNHDDGTFQRYQVVSGFSWKDIHYFNPGIERKSIVELVRLYDVNIIPKLPIHSGPFVFLHVPDDDVLDLDRNTEEGYIYDDSVLLAITLGKAFREGSIKWNGSDLIAEDENISRVLRHLEEIGMLGISKDDGDGIHFIPVNGKLGFVSRKKDVQVSVNSHFFLMDPTDIDSPYCRLATPHGLILENGIITNPPLNHRALLLVDGNGNAKIGHVELKDLEFKIDGVTYIDGKNCTLHFRPDERTTPKIEGTDIIITEDHVVALKKGGESVIPVAGFVISVPGDIELQDNGVLYMGLEDYIFASQVGPEMMDEGVMIDHLIFPFYRMGKDPVVYAPTVYPLPFETARASRICLGTNEDSSPVLIWAEGAGKLGIDKELDSTGASLLEMAEFCRSQHYRNIINLDGGGSAALNFQGKRLMKIADRMPQTNDECERPVPNGLYIQ